MNLLWTAAVPYINYRTYSTFEWLTQSGTCKYLYTVVMVLSIFSELTEESLGFASSLQHAMLHYCQLPASLVSIV